MADIFVSYAREDQGRVEPIVKALEHVGFSVWWDRRIPGGVDFVADTERELNEAAACVVCWGRHSIGSLWVRDEASAAAEQGKIVPVQLDGERPPMGLRQYQCIDLSAWDGDPAAPSFVALVEAVRKRTKKTPPAAEAAESSIAVLPFINLSGDSTCQNFCDAVGADCISLLAMNKDLKVLARGSSFVHRGSEGVAEIGRRLGVRYVLDGTIRRAVETVRITVDLVLSETGQLLWSGKTEGRLDDVFALQDEMARYIAAVIAPELGRFERELAARKNPDTLTAWECAQRGAFHLYKQTAIEAQEAEKWFSRAIALDDGFAHGHAGLANAYIQLAHLGARTERGLMLEAALKASTEALLLAPNDAYCHCMRSRAMALAGDFDEAGAAADEAIALNPSDAFAWFAKGCALLQKKTAKEAIAAADRAIAMSPQHPFMMAMQSMKSFAHLLDDDLVGAESAARCSVRQHNAPKMGYAALAAILGLKGDRIGAAAVARRLLEFEPDYRADFIKGDTLFIADEVLKARLVEGLKAAGLP